MGLNVRIRDDQGDGGSLIDVEGPYRYVEVNGVKILSDFTCTFTTLVPGVQLVLEVHVTEGGPHCTAVTFRAVGPRRDVPAGVLRDFKLEDMFEAACERAVHPGEAPDAWAQMRQSDLTMPTEAWSEARERARRAVSAARRTQRRRYTDELLREVADIYAANAAAFPTRAVREHFDVAQSTAQLYVKKARERGFLTATAAKAGRP